MRRVNYGALLMMGVMLMLMLFMPEQAIAQQTAAPWDQGVCKFAQAVTGPWVTWVAIIAIVIAAVMWGLGESNQGFQTALRIVAGFSLAISAVTVFMWFFPDATRRMAGCTLPS